METLTMSRKERERMTIMVGVQERELTLVQAAELMGVCHRQSRRIWQRYQAGGDAGLVHRLRGRPSARRKPPALRAQAQALYAQERYADFGPTLMAEQLAKQKLVVDHETLRRWRMAAGQHPVRRRKQKHRQWRERKPSFGAMVQLDGSHHDWFEGRSPKCVLMVMVDDATNRMRARFFPEETTRASYDVLEGWVRKHGLPASLYVDRDSIYRCEGEPSMAEQLAGQAPQTQFGRAMEALGVELILAHSPQAKGRVERMNGTLQDRLVKELRLAGINDLESANRFLDGQYLRAFHRQFARAAASPVAVHRAVPRHLNEVLSWEEERVVQGDWTVACAGQRYQVGPPARGAEPGAAQGDRAHVAQRAGAVGASGPATPVAEPARRSGEDGGTRARTTDEAAENQNGPSAGGAPSVAAIWSGRGAEVLARDSGRRREGARGAAGGAGLRSSVAPLRPPCVPHPQPGKADQQQSTTKGTFSREFQRGHF
jgi:hypothetical protein